MSGRKKASGGAREGSGRKPTGRNQRFTKSWQADVMKFLKDKPKDYVERLIRAQMPFRAQSFTVEAVLNERAAAVVRVPRSESNSPSSIFIEIFEPERGENVFNSFIVLQSVSQDKKFFEIVMVISHPDFKEKVVGQKFKVKVTF